MNPTAEDILNPEKFLREAFGEEEISKENTKYPNSEQRPRIYKAMHKFASMLADKTRDHMNQYYDKELKFWKDAVEEQRKETQKFKNEMEEYSLLKSKEANALLSACKDEVLRLQQMVSETQDKHEYVMRDYHTMCRGYREVKAELEEVKLFAKEAADKAWDAGSDRSIIKGSSAYIIRKETFMKELFKQ